MMEIDRKTVEQALEALELALGSHGVLLLSDPPQDAWKTRGVESKSLLAITALRAALAQKPVVLREGVHEINGERWLFTNLGTEADFKNDKFA